jgi:hypothetical protein
MFNNLAVILAQAAAPVDASGRINGFLDTGLGRFIQTILVVAGFVVVIWSLSKVVMKALQGNTTGALKSFLIGLFLAALFFNLSLIGTFIDWASALWGGVADTGETVVNDAK